MCQNSTDSQKPLSGACAKVQGQATAQLQLSNQSPVICQLGISVMGDPRFVDRVRLFLHPPRAIASGPTNSPPCATVPAQGPPNVLRGQRHVDMAAQERVGSAALSQARLYSKSSNAPASTIAGL